MSDIFWKAAERQDEIAETAHLRQYGYAPGGYLCRCAEKDCKDWDGMSKTDGKPALGTFIGDKRAWRCQTCAQAMCDKDLAVKDTLPRRAPQLVRDKMVPRMGFHEANERLPAYLAVPFLINKVHDEIGEVSRDLANPEEYADVLEALMCLAWLNGISEAQIHEARRLKSERKGGLVTGNLWVPEPFMENYEANK